MVRGRFLEKKYLIIIFDHKLSLRSYLETEVIKELSSKFYLKIKVFGNLDYDFQNLDHYSENMEFINLTKIQRFILSIYANSYWWKVAEKSLSIQNRTWYYKKGKISVVNASAVGKILSNLSMTPLIKLSIFSLKNILNNLYSQITDKISTTILYVSTGGTNSISDQLAVYFSNLGIKVFTVVENLDNISSKGIFAYPPNLVGVWGKQSIKFAAKIHEVDSNAVIAIGNPRVEWLINNVVFEGERNDIFFGGGSVDFSSELEYLKIAIRVAEQNRIKLFYLPHPKCYDLANFYISKLRSESLILLCRNNVSNQWELGSLPNLKDYLYPYSKAKIFISSFSTMNVEAALLGIKSLVIDLKTRTSPIENRISQRHDHIKDLVDFEAFQFLNNEIDFENQLNSDILKDKNYNNGSISTSHLDYIINTKEIFVEKLIMAIRSLR
jgi:hypothetical protein